MTANTCSAVPRKDWRKLRAMSMKSMAKKSLKQQQQQKKETKKMYEVAGNRNLKRSNNKRQRMPLGHETLHTCSPIKSLPKGHSLNVNYVKIYEPRYARAFSPRFLTLISTNHNLSFARHHTQSLLNHSFSCI